MRFPKHRSDKETLSVYYMVGGAGFIALLLIVLWENSAPPEIAEPAPAMFSQNGRSSTNNPGSNVWNSTQVPEKPPSNAADRGPDNKGKDETYAEDTKDDLKVGQNGQQAQKADVSPESTESEQVPKEKTDKLPEEISTQAELTSETKEETSNFETQGTESKEEELVIQNEEAAKGFIDSSSDTSVETELKSTLKELAVEGEEDVHEMWELCSWEGAQDYIPCLDNSKAIEALPSTKHFQHRERHCPSEEDLPKCLVPLPKGYKKPIQWILSRDQIWLKNVPHTGLVSYKKDQNWVKQEGDKFIFPGGGTQFKIGTLHYIEFIQEMVPSIAWGKHTRVVLDVGCGVASFGGYLFDKDVITMSFAPKDDHEAQVQFALERGIPAFSAVMGTQRLVFPSNAFDAVHCGCCGVSWHAEGGILLVELNRVLRPGGFFIWSATPVYSSSDEDKKIWTDTLTIVQRLSWSLLVKRQDPQTGVGVVVFQKPEDNELYDLHEVLEPPYCEEDDKPDAAWYVPMKACIHRIPTGEGARSEWPREWPLRVESAPSWLTGSKKGIYGSPAVQDYESDTAHWNHVIQKSYLEGVGLNWSTIRNVMDMKAGYGGFAAALITQQLWVMNIVPVNEPDTLPVIFDRGLIGMYHDWCEPHSTYPRSYDLLHADHLLSTIKCNDFNLVLEMDRILRPEGWAIFRDRVTTLGKVEEMLQSLHWKVILSYTQEKEQLLVAQKTFWRPEGTSR